MNKWSKNLHLLGLSTGEITVYMTALQLGPEPVQTIAKKSELSRVTVYSAIESLTKLGLMTSVEKGKKLVYAAEPPERILSLAETRLNSLQTVTREIKSNIDELKMMQTGDKPVVKMFEGLEAFSAIQEDVLKSKATQICEFGNLDEIDRVYPYEKQVYTKYLDTLAKRNKTMRRLVYLSKIHTPRTTEDNKQIVYLDESKFNFFGDLFFYDDTVWISSFKNQQVTVMIKNQEIKDTLQATFEIIWNSLKKSS